MWMYLAFSTKRLRHKKMTVAIAIILILLESSSSSSLSASIKSASRCYESIVSFGDSLADTGNQLLLCPANKPPRSGRPPYGRTFFHHPTGRCSDGRLVIDFIAQSLGLPLVQPYIGGKKGAAHGQIFSKGVNFAVVGATAFDYEFYAKRGIYNPDTNVSLGTQLDWFKQFLATIPDSRKFLQKSLVLMGEIGGNDYNYPIMQGTSPEVIQSFAPPVIDYIGSTIEELIKLGVETMLVPGILPIGCLPVYLTQFKTTSTPKDYDPRTGCLNWLNKFIRYHNELLLKELNRIRELYPHVAIIYADYYNAAMRFYLSPNEFGFTEGLLRACCGAGGPYNYNESALCSIPPSTSCDDPSSFVSWDGIHLTEAAYKLIAQGLLEGPYTTPQIRTICPYISRASQEQIKLGAMTLMVPGSFPIGCSAAYLTYFRSSNENEYDPKTGCLNWPNRFSQYHNKLLQLELNRIQQQNPNNNIIYADYFNAAMRVYRSPQKYGFAKGALRACCGGGGPYNVNFTLPCGYGGSETCEDPSLYVSWDGLHLTDAAYKWIGMGLLRGCLTIPQLNSVCALSSKNAAGFSDH